VTIKNAHIDRFVEQLAHDARDAMTFGRHHVAPSIAEFLERYPKLSV
jgi:DNA-binding transcriptional LysR family regulator